MSIFSRLLPFLLIGMFIVALVAGLILLSYLLVFGAIVGFFLFALAWIKEKFFTNKELVPYKKPRKESNRTIDHEDK